MAGRLVGLIVAIVALIGVTAFVMIDGNHAAQKREREATASDELKASAVAVSELPKGVQAQWERFADDRFDHTVTRENGSLKIRTLTGSSNFSLNTPYQISCAGLGISINFGQEEDAPAAHVLGDYVFNPQSPKQEPALGVDRQSIAAMKLGEHLCARVSQRMHDLVAG